MQVLLDGGADPAMLTKNKMSAHDVIRSSKVDDVTKQTMAVVLIPGLAPPFVF